MMKMETQAFNKKGNEFPLSWFREKKTETIEAVAKIAKEVAKDEMSLFGLELAFATVPKKKLDKIAKDIKALRKQRWEKVLKITKGDKLKALSIYDEIYPL